jgi:hypothetical protein
MGSENLMQFFSNGQWNDMDNYGNSLYIVEYAPEPATLLTLTLGTVAMLKMRRRRGRYTELQA